MSGTTRISSVAVVGVGGVGGYFGSRLAAAGPPAGRHVSFLARGAHAQAILRDGLRLVGCQAGELLCRPDLLTDDAGRLPVPDLCLVCVKVYDLAEALRRLSPRLAEHSVVLPLLNGVDIYERVVDACPQAIVLPACAYLSAHVETPGIVRLVGQEGAIVLGADPRRPGHDTSPLRAVLQEAGIRHTWSEDPFAAVWQKYLFIASFGLVTAWSAKSVGEVLADGELTALVREVMGEILALAHARGVRLAPGAAEQALQKARSFPPQTRTSYQRDVESGRPNEGELFGGAILRLGREMGVRTPVTGRLHPQIRAHG